MLGTPPYMPPEQALGRREEIGPHSDVYAFGAMLYELIGGQPPYVTPDRKTDSQRILEELRLGPPAPLAPDVAVPADLISICEKAMARLPADRYHDMNELVEDLRAFLEDRVVRAHRTGAVAELRKWVRRNRRTAWMGMALLASTVGGLSAFAAERSRAASLEQQANVALREARDEAEQEAENARRERAVAERVVAFMIDLFKAPRPEEDLGQRLTARQLLDSGSRRIEHELGDDPLVLYQLRATIGWSYQMLGGYDRAEQQLQGAMDLALRLPESSSILMIEPLMGLSAVHRELGQPHLALEESERSLALSRQVYGEEHETTLRARLAVCLALAVLEDRALANQMLEALHGDYCRILGEAHARTLTVLTHWAGLQDKIGETIFGEKLMRP